MIKSNELRCGNLVWDNYGGIYKVVNINSEGFDYIDAVKPRFKAIGRYELEYIQPIPLTEEWHNRFGVKLNGFKQFQYDLTERKSVIFSGDYVYLVDIERMDGIRGLDDNICTLWNNDLKRRNMYVHEWQNLYFALTQTELTPSDGGKIE